MGVCIANASINHDQCTLEMLFLPLQCARDIAIIHAKQALSQQVFYMRTDHGFGRSATPFAISTAGIAANQLTIRVGDHSWNRVNNSPQKVVFFSNGAFAFAAIAWIQNFPRLNQCCHCFSLLPASSPSTHLKTAYTPYSLCFTDVYHPQSA